jgi:predicted metal-dependent phosphoesterase TrpH
MTAWPFESGSKNLSNRDVTVSLADLHIHTTCSDGAASPRQMASGLVNSKLAVAAVTDHDSVEGALRVRDELRGEGPEIVIGAEITTTDGHLLALYIDADLPSGRSARETVELIHERGGLAIAAHPYFPFCGLGGLAGRLAFDGIEIDNGTPLGELANSLARRRLGAASRALLGGSDAHVLGAVGHVHTLFPGRTAADLRRAIECCQTQPAFDWKRHLQLSPVLLARVAWVTLGNLLPTTKTARATQREGDLRPR